MTRTTVEISAASPAGVALKHRNVTIQLVHGGSGGSDGETLIGGITTIDLGETGTASVDLDPNEELEPEGTFYRLAVAGVVPSVVRDIVVPVSEDPVSWADPALEVFVAAPPTWVATKGDPGFLAPGLLADRPAASSVDDGVGYFATDDATLYIAADGAWTTAAHPGSLLAIAEPSSAPTQVIGAHSTDYRIDGLTVDFTMPAGRARIEVSELMVAQGLVQTYGQISLWYSTDAWSTKVALQGVTDPTIPGVAPFWLPKWAPFSVFMPSSVAAGTAVSVAVFVSTTQGTPTLTVPIERSSSRTTTRRPHLAAFAV